MSVLLDQRTELLNGKYTPCEARIAINKLIDLQITQCKQKYLTRWEQDCTQSMRDLESRVNDLNNLKENLLRTVNKAREEDCMLSLRGSIDIELTH